MTLEDLNQHLGQIEELEKSQELLISLRNAAHPGAAVMTGMPHAPGVKDKVGDLATEIADLTEMIRHLEQQIAVQEPRILEFLTGVEDNRIRMMLRLRFVRGLSWKEVASIMGRWTTTNGVKSACYRALRERSDTEHGSEG